MSYELKENYPLQPDKDPSHDLSKGLRRHFPECYPDKPLPFWPCLLIMAGAYAMGRVLL